MSTIEEQIEKVAVTYLESDEGKNNLRNAALATLDKLGISVTTIEHVIKKSGNTKKIGNVHFKFPTVLACITARTPIALVGPAGSFKTSTVEKVAQALSLDFYSKSVSVQTGIHEFFGYQDANGNYVPTLFRKAYEEGGVFLLDEFDAGNPNVLASLNQATANGACAFADKMVPKHEDFVLVMAGNTYGNGATQEYVGRNKIDAATLDRFVFIHFPYDEGLEKKISGNVKWFETVKKYRNRAAAKKIQAIISPRATLLGAALLKAGLSQYEVEQLTIFKGMSEQEISLLATKEVSDDDSPF